jgi:hypothetical protein
MSDNSTHLGPTSPQALIDELRAEITTAPDGDRDPGIIDSGKEDAVNAPLSRHAADSLIVRAADTLLNSLDVAPTREMQVRLTENVRSIVASRRTPLPTLLEAGRMEAHLAPEELAPRLSMSPAHLVALETGRRPLWKARRKNPVGLVLQWIDLLKIDTTTAVLAARRLEINASDGALAGRNQLDIDRANTFAKQLLAALDHRDANPESDE